MRGCDDATWSPERVRGVVVAFVTAFLTGCFSSRTSGDDVTPRDLGPELGVRDADVGSLVDAGHDASSDVASAFDGALDAAANLDGGQLRDAGPGGWSCSDGTIVSSPIVSALSRVCFGTGSVVDARLEVGEHAVAMVKRRNSLSGWYSNTGIWQPNYGGWPPRLATTPLVGNLARRGRDVLETEEDYWSVRRMGVGQYTRELPTTTRRPHVDGNAVGLGVSLSTLSLVAYADGAWTRRADVSNLVGADGTVPTMVAIGGDARVLVSAGGGLHALEPREPTTVPVAQFDAMITALDIDTHSGAAAVGLSDGTVVLFGRDGTELSRDVSSLEGERVKEISAFDDGRFSVRTAKKVFVVGRGATQLAYTVGDSEVMVDAVAYCDRLIMLMLAGAESCGVRTDVVYLGP